MFCHQPWEHLNPPTLEEETPSFWNAGGLCLRTTMKKRSFSFSFSLPVTLVVLVIAYIYFSTLFVFIDRWFGLMTSPGIMNALVFTAIALMCVFNYSISLFTDPGRVPSTYMPDIEDSQNPIHEIKRKVQTFLFILNFSQLGCFLMVLL